MTIPTENVTMTLPQAWIPYLCFGTRDDLEEVDVVLVESFKRRTGFVEILDVADEPHVTRWHEAGLECGFRQVVCLDCEVRVKTEEWRRIEANLISVEEMSPAENARIAREMLEGHGDVVWLAYEQLLASTKDMLRDLFPNMPNNVPEGHYLDEISVAREALAMLGIEHERAA